MKPYSYFLLICMLIAGLSLASCGGGGDDTPPDGDQEQEAAVDGDDEVDQVEEAEEDGDVEEAEDEITEDEVESSDEEIWTGTKCSADDRHTNDRDVDYNTQETSIAYCDEESDIDGARVMLAKGGVGYVLRDDVHVVISEDENDITMAGWKPVGPAVKFTATPVEDGDTVRLNYDVEFRIPFDESELPEYARDFYIYVAFKVDEDNEVIPDTWDGKPEFAIKSYQGMTIQRWPGLASVQNDRFGTYQVMVPETAPETSTRDFTFRAIAGISMGCGGAAINGLLYPDKFDLLGPMGGPMDLRYLAANMSDTYLSGFCSMDEILADSSEAAIDAFVTNINGQCGAQEFSDEYPQGHPDGYPQRTSKHWSTPVYKWYMKAPREVYKTDERVQGYNHWYYDSDGGGFDRNSYVHLFRDLSYAFGNPSNYNPDSPYFAAGLTGDPNDENTRLGYYMKNIYKPDGSFSEAAEEKGCRNLALWMKDNPLYGFYDRKYNPDGSHPVIYFCDGNNSAEEVESGDYQPHTYFKDTGADGLYNQYEPGYNASTNPDPNGDDYNATTNPTGTEGNNKWDAYEPEKARSLRFDLAMAVDYNRNGIRDFGEPVIGQFFEPYEDCGTDGKCNEQETGYDPDTNPDPNGDDYSPYTNPLGTEGNFIFDAGESYEDLGLDGVTCPVKGACEFDYGEGNGKFDYNPNLENMLAHDPFLNIAKLTEEQLLSTSVWLDGGIRDLFNFVIMGDNLYAAFADRLNALGVSTGSYQDFPSLASTLLRSTKDFKFGKINFPQVGHVAMVRYGNYEATDDNVAGGNGRHVDEGNIVSRVTSFFGYADSIFPNGDYEKISLDVSNSTENRSYYSEKLGRQDKYVVAFPPGYYDYNEDGANNGPDTCTKRYPVVYFGHGYGMDPEGMAATVLIMGTDMARGKIQKMITVMTNGRCYDQSQCNEDCTNVCYSETYECKQSCIKENCSKKSKADDVSCEEQCQIDCAADCITSCKGSDDRDCANVVAECDKGTFYTDHVANKNLPINGNKGTQASGSILDLIDYIDANYCTKKPEEDVEVDATSRLPIY